MSNEAIPAMVSQITVPLAEAASEEVYHYRSFIDRTVCVMTA